MKINIKMEQKKMKELIRMKNDMSGIGYSENLLELNNTNIY
jgi:hypothetical protein